MRGAAAIAGIGQTEFSKDSGRSELQLAAEASLAALEDAGLTVADVDGMVTFTIDPTDDVDLMRVLGVRELSYSVRLPHGGAGSGATVLAAAMAVATGVADHVLVYRALNARSGRRFGRARPPTGPGDRHGLGLHQLGRTVWGTQPGGRPVAAGIALHALVRRHQRGLRALRRGDP